jgi:hypothetical protein
MLPAAKSVMLALAPFHLGAVLLTSVPSFSHCAYFPLLQVALEMISYHTRAHPDEVEALWEARPSGYVRSS